MASFFVWLFAVPWTGFSLFWTCGACAEAGPMYWAPLLIGIPFTLIGLVVLSVPYWVWREVRQACYVLTDRRAICWGKMRGVRGVAVRSYRREHLAKMHRVERRDGSGDLVFESTTTCDSTGRERTRHCGFMGIERVREVEELLRRTLLE
jgi:hypothetical protein